MNLLSNYIERGITIVQPSVWKQQREILSGDERLGSIQKPKIFSTIIVVELFGKEWEVYSPSIWRQERAVRPKGYQMPIAKYVHDRWKTSGTIELPMGRRLKHVQKPLKRINEITTESGIVLASYNSKGLLGKTMEITFYKPSELLDKYPWAIILVWDVIQAQQQQHAAVH